VDNVFVLELFKCRKDLSMKWRCVAAADFQWR